MVKAPFYKSFIFWPLLIFIFSFIIYSNSLQNNFLAGDDQNIILNNAYLRDLKYFPKFFSQNYDAGSGVVSNFWRPFQLAVYSLAVHTAGYKPWAFHIWSILFHGLCGVLIFVIFSRLFQRKISSAIIGLLTLAWVAHPIHNEELSLITGIASPGYLFWILFGLLAFLNFEEKNKLHWYLISLASFVFALFFKESAVIFPGLVLGMHITCVKTGLLKRIKIRDYVCRHISFWLIALFYVISRLTFLNFSNTINFYNQANVFTQNIHYRFYTLFTVLAYGLRIIFFPAGLYPERSWPVFASFFSAKVYLSFLILAAIFIIAIMRWKKNPLFSFGLFWFFCTYLPMANIAVQINALVWDHWFYVPSVGICLSLISLFPRLKSLSYQRLAWIFLIAIPVILGTLTFLRNPHWKDTESLCRFILAHEPGSARLWTNLGMSLSERGETEKAVQCYLTAISLSDTYPQTHHNLALSYLQLGKYDLAEKEFLTAIEMNNKFYYSYLDLGRLYLWEGKKEKAVYYFKKAAEIYPYLPKDTLDFIKRFTE